MSYKIEISRREEKTNGKVVRDDIVISKTTMYEGFGGIETVHQGGLISFPYEDLTSFIEDVKAHIV